MLRAWKFFAAAAMAVLLVGCGPHDDPDNGHGHGYILRGTLGTYSDGSGRLGLALLASLRDPESAGPATPWQGELWSGEELLASGFSYDVSGSNSAAAFWFPSVPAQLGNHYRLQLRRDDAAALSITLSLGALDELEPARLRFSGSDSIQWDPVTDASTYVCRASSDGAVQLEIEHPEPACDVSRLPAGDYRASVFALSTAVAEMATRAGQSPELPPGFYVSEARLGFVRGDGGSENVRLVAAGGQFHYGVDLPGLAVLLELQEDGNPPAEDWAVEVFGPGLSPDSPLRFTLPASSSRRLVWSYDVEASPGIYTAVAHAGDRTISSQFTVADGGVLEIPRNVSATPRPNGALELGWEPVPGARSHFVAVYGAGAFVAGMWSDTESARFPVGTLIPGDVYQAYVTSTDVDLQAADFPARVVVAEDAFNPITFTAQ